MAAVFNLNEHATYVHFHIGHGSPPFFVFSLSVSNILVIAAMLLLFVLAILLPFPHPKGAEVQQ
jgi:hypothetical protein